MYGSLICGHALAELCKLPAESVHCIVTSPPYWGLRNYKIDGQIGHEKTPGEYVSRLVEIFREARRVLRGDGVFWLNLGDTYASNGGHSDACCGERRGAYRVGDTPEHAHRGFRAKGGLAPKNLAGIPWRTALALQDDGWWLRSEIIWHKPNSRPESVTDRPNVSHEQVFLFTKSSRYYFDHYAIQEPSGGYHGSSFTKGKTAAEKRRLGMGERVETNVRNCRSVWSIPTQPYKGAHFAVFPEELPRRCILAGTGENGCCPKCGKSYKRVVEKETIPHDGTTGSQYPVGSTANRLALLRQAARARGEEYSAKVKTIGWQSGCDCGAGAPIPCVVLDPFGGSGTTAKAAAKLNRSWVLIELNPQYCDLARERLGLPPAAGLQAAFDAYVGNP